jgi:hypothetical protein
MKLKMQGSARNIVLLKASMDEETAASAAPWLVRPGFAAELFDEWGPLLSCGAQS